MKPRKSEAAPSGFSFGAVSDGPITEEEARDVVGPALLEIAEKHKVKDIRALSKRLVFNEVKAAGKEHPLWPFIFHCSVAAAAEKYFIERCGLLVKSIEIVKVRINTIHRERAFVPASEVLQHSPSGGFTKRPGHVLREDALKNDPEYQSVLGGGLRRFIAAFEWVETWASKRQQTPEIAELVSAVRQAIDDYKRESGKAA